MTDAGWGDRGQATVELALVLPLVAALLLVVAQMGLVVRDRVLVTHATREAVRAASITEGDRTTAARRAAERAAGLDAARLAVAVEVVDAGSAVRVTLHYRSVTALPLVGDLLPDPELDGSATMRIESVVDDGP